MSEAHTREQRVQEYLQRILSAGDFPALSERLHAVIAVLGQEQASMQALANIVLRDYSLTLKVLRTANTFRYNRSGRHVLSVTQAMVLLGAENVRDLASSLMIIDHIARKAPALKQLMALSMLSASHARLAAEHIGYGRPEEAHLAAMFRNVGEVLVAWHFPDEYGAIMARVRDDQRPIGEAAQTILGVRFEELGAAACRHWGLEGFGCGPANALSPSTLDRLVAFGHDLTNAVYRHVPTESPQTLTLILQRYGHALSQTPDTLQHVLREGCLDTNEMLANLGLSTADLRLGRLVDAAVTTLGASDDSRPAAPPSAGAGPFAADVAAQGPETPGARQLLIDELERALANAAHFEVNEVLLTVLEAILRAGPFTRTALCMLTDQRTELVGRFGLGDLVDVFVKRLRFPMTMGAQGLAVGAAMLRRVDLFAAASRNPSAEEARLLALLGAQSVLVLPLVIEGRAVGAIVAVRAGTATPPDAATVTFVAQLRDLAVRAMQRARSAREDASKRAADLGAEARRDLVLRVIRGETIDAVSRETGVPARELEAWRQAFLDGATRALMPERRE
jgi:HD-like signal output (HDOD) protein/GAF domain-containing protein